MATNQDHNTTEDGEQIDGQTVSELRERLRSLEQSHKELLGKLPEDNLVGRRALLKTSAAALAGGGLMGAGAGSAAADGTTDDTDTKWGSPTNRDDYYVDALDAIAVDTDKLNTADIANAASGEVPQAQGDGTLAFVTPNHTKVGFEKLGIQSDQTGVSSGVWTSINWDEQKADGGFAEFNSNNNIRITEAGNYLWSINVFIASGSSEHDVFTRFGPEGSGGGVGYDGGRATSAGQGYLEMVTAQNVGTPPVDYEVEVNQQSGNSGDIKLQDGRTYIAILKIGESP